MMIFHTSGLKRPVHDADRSHKFSADVKREFAFSDFENSFYSVLCKIQTVPSILQDFYFYQKSAKFRSVIPLSGFNPQIIW